MTAATSGSAPTAAPTCPTARGTSYGLMGGMIRLPVAGHDILLYSNVDTDAGVMPKSISFSKAIRKGATKPFKWSRST